MGYSKAFTVVPMADLDRAREAAKAQMAEIYKATGVKLRMRTFYLGSRRPQRRGYSRPNNTLKADARGAKLAFYKRLEGSSARFDYYDLIGYY